MNSSRSTAAPNAVDVRSLIRLYVTTLEARGYARERTPVSDLQNGFVECFSSAFFAVEPNAGTSIQYEITKQVRYQAPDRMLRFLQGL
jgi:hypothetical protein